MRCAIKPRLVKVIKIKSKNLGKSRIGDTIMLTLCGEVHNAMFGVCRILIPDCSKELGNDLIVPWILHSHDVLEIVLFQNSKCLGHFRIIEVDTMVPINVLLLYHGLRLS